MSLIYFAHPIDAPGADIWPRIADIEQALDDHNLSAYHPWRAFRLNNFSGRQVSWINEAAQSECDATLAYYPAGSHSFGVPVEIQRAVDARQPVAIISDTDGAAWPAPDAPLVGRFSEALSGIKCAVEWLLAVSTMPHRLDRLAQHVRIPQDAIVPNLDDLPVRLMPGHPAKLPTRGHDDDAGLDLYVTQSAVVWPHTFTDIHCGVQVQLPRKTWGYLTGRSSTLRTRGLLVNPGVIDCGYRGELYAGCWNLTDEPVRVEPGERIAQLILIDNATERYLPIEAETLDDHPRGTNGFGSTGR